MRTGAFTEEQIESPSSDCESNTAYQLGANQRQLVFGLESGQVRTVLPAPPNYTLGGTTFAR